MRAAVVGASGQLGKALSALLGDRVVWSGGRSTMDLRDPVAVSRVVSEVRPDVVFNAAAYNNVDAAECCAAEALGVNAGGPRHLALACAEAGALLVHVSSDYVFDGLRDLPYTEEDPPHPRCAYGVSKLAGELMVASSRAPHLIVRTSGLFGKGGSRDKGGCFVERILARARSGGPVRVVGDQVFSPTYAPDLARALVGLVEAGARGLFHVSNSGSCSWHDLAVAAVEASGLRVRVARIGSGELRAPAPRPAYSVLSNTRYESLGFAPLRPWREALAQFLIS